MKNAIFVLGKSTLFIYTFLIVYHQVNAQASLPALTRFAVPNPAPTPPGDAFILPLNLKLTTDSPAATAPICAEWTRTAGPDESILITGTGFSAFADDQQGKDARFVLADGQGRLIQSQIQRLEADKAVLTLSKDLPPWSMYLLWPANQVGYGAPIALNQTEAWWVGPDKSAPGATVSVYGRNLANRNGTLTSYVYLKPKQSASLPGQWVKVSGVNPYRVSFQLPASLPTGDYEVWTHNGHGGQYGWSGPLTLTVQTAPVWTSVRFDVKAYGAQGNASKDDTKAIQQALAAARQSPGSTVYFPPGVYIINDQLDMGSNTRWQGSGKDVSVLRCGPAFSTKAFTMLYGHNLSTIELADLTFDTNRSYKGNYNGNLNAPLYLRGSRDVKLTNLRFSCQDYNVLDLHLSRYVFMSGCEHTGIASFLGDASQLSIDRCNFRLTNDTDAALFSWGGAGVSLTNSTCQDYDNTDPTNGAGWGKGRFFLGAGNWGSNRFTYIANNTTTDLAPRPQGGVDANSGEQFLWEGNRTDWSGSPSTSTAWTTTVQDFSAAYASQHQAIIIKGRGLGQSRRIKGYSNGTITVETPWNVVPDPSSVIAVGNFVDRVVLYQNSIDGKAYAAASPTHVASAGIQPYGGVTNLIADGNTLRDLRSGIANWATQHAVGLDPNYFNLFANNRMLSCRWGMQNATDAQRADGTAILGTIYRKNEVRDALVAGITNVLYPSVYPLLDGLIYEHNSFINVPSGYSTEVHFRGLHDFSTQSGSITNQVLYANRFSGGGGAAIAITPKVALRDNTFVGFSPVYTGSRSKPVLEAPMRVLNLSGDPAGGMSKTNLTLWNSGTNALSWQVSSSAAWLSPLVSNGSISDEGASTTVALQANPSNLSAGEHSATVFARVGSDQIKQFTVTFTVPVPLTVPTTTPTTAPPPNPTTTAGFAITGVTTVSCTTVSAGQRQLTFTPQYGGLNGQPVSFSVVGLMLPTTSPAPYTLRIYIDNPTVSLRAQQSGTSASYAYNWLAACTNTAPTPTPPANQPPRLAQAIAAQSATVGQPFSLAIPQGTFSDPENQPLTYAMSGLPAGLSFAGGILSGTPAAAGQSTLTLTATDPGNLTANTNFGLTVITAPPPNPTTTAGFAITGVTTVSCTTVSAGQRQLTFTPQYGGLNGQPVSFSVVGLMLPTTSPAPYTLRIYIDNPTVSLRAQQSGTSASYAYNWLAACTNTAPTGPGSSVSAPNSINWEYWNMSPGDDFSRIPVSTKSTGSKLLDKFAAPTDFSNYYGSRVRGYVRPPVDGNYVFYIAGDDKAELYLSTDDNPANKRKIAYADWTCQKQYDRNPSQQSGPIQLKAGQRYYIEALHLEGNADDYLYVGWKLPDGTLQRPIAGQHLIPYAQSGAREGVEMGVIGLDGQLNYLSNAYPNPFHEKTTIEFAFPMVTDALVQVFDVQGNLIKTLFKGAIDAEKKYQVEFSGSQYAGGEYICRLTCKEGVFTQKLILTK